MNVIPLRKSAWRASSSWGVVGTDKGTFMHVTRFAAIALLALPLGGCFGVTVPSQPLPDWAMSPQAQYEEEPAAAPVKHRAVRRAAPPQAVSLSDAMMTGEVSATPQASAKPSARARPALDDEGDASLRQTMTICRGC